MPLSRYDLALLPLHAAKGVVGFTGFAAIVAVKGLWGRMKAHRVEDLEEDVATLAKICQQMYGGEVGVKGREWGRRWPSLRGRSSCWWLSRARALKGRVPYLTFSMTGRSFSTGRIPLTQPLTCSKRSSMRCVSIQITQRSWSQATLWAGAWHASWPRKPGNLVNIAPFRGTSSTREPRGTCSTCSSPSCLAALLELCL